MEGTKNFRWLGAMGQAILICLAVSLVGCHTSKPDPADSPDPAEPVEHDFSPFGFPFAQPSHIVYLASFGIPNWSGTEPHNGIDLVIDQNLSSTRIVSPTVGVVTGITMTENPYSHPPGQLILTITIYVNSEWVVSLVMEPGTTDPNTKTAQRNAVLVAEKQTVVPGEPLADVLVGELGHPCLHFMVTRGKTFVCAYAHSSLQAQSLFDDIVRMHADSYLPNGHICYVEAF